MKLHELAVREEKGGKAGCIPYVVNGKKIQMAFMISSNADFGGPDPMIAKGHIDPGETPKQAAIREAQEELGLRTTNIVDGTLEEGWVGQLKGMVDSYPFHVFICQVDDLVDFDEPHYETKEVVWLTEEEFMKKGRSSQRPIIKAIMEKIRA